MKDKWIDVKRTKKDIEMGYELCPKCKGVIQVLTDGIVDKAERCPKGCYLHYYPKDIYEE